MRIRFNLLTGPALFDKVESLLPQHRERRFPPTETLSTFRAQALGADRSCQKAVEEAAIKRLGAGLGGRIKGPGSIFASIRNRCRAWPEWHLLTLSRVTMF